MSTDAEATVLIIGAGIFGSSTAYHLSKVYRDASKIVVVDQGPFPPSLAASTDINKIIRSDYADPFYCELAHEAIDAWATWPELKQYYHKTGWVMLDNKGSDLAHRIRATLREHDWDHTEDVPLSELDQKWKGILRGSSTTGFQDAYWNPDAGWCDAANATAAIMQAALDRGAQYISDEIVELKHGQAGVSVKTRSGRSLAADKIVLATGAWTSSLMSPLEDCLNISEHDRFERQATAAGVCVAHYKMSDEDMSALSDMPVIVYGEFGEVIPPASRLLKYTNAHTFTNTVTTPTGHKISVPPNRDQHVVSKALQVETERNMMSKIMPAFARGREADYWRLCWDARTPTQDWLLDRHPTLSNLYFAVGGSFHSYKFLPNAGAYMANVLSGRGNGAVKDRRWAWKVDTPDWRGAHEKTAPKRELLSLE